MQAHVDTELQIVPGLPVSEETITARLKRDRSSSATQDPESSETDSEASRTPPRSRAATHPLGPMLMWTESVHPRRERLRAVALLMMSCLILALAAWLEPDPHGMGTHKQLGLSACSLPMLTGFPCPTCGMTTAFAHAVRGQLLSAFFAQPAGLLFAILTMAAGMVSCLTLVTTRNWRINWYRVRPNLVAFSAVAVILGAWVFKLILCWFAKDSS